MNVLTDTWRGLVRRRLWPVALLLIAAVAAVPILLSKRPVSNAAPASVPPATGATASTGSGETVFVSAAPEAQGSGRRHVIGARKDPFAPAPLPKPKKHAKASKSSASATATPTPEPSSPAPSSTPAPTTPTPPVSSAPAPAPLRVVYAKDSLSVRFGPTSADPIARTLNRRHALPSTFNPLLVYMGLEDNGKTAVFMVGSDVTKLEGDGRCEPDLATCDTLRLKAGETEFVSTNSAQYELDLVKIHHTTQSRLGKPGTTTPTGVSARASRRAPRRHVHF
jgi:hypothetical protein